MLVVREIYYLIYSYIIVLFLFLLVLLEYKCHTALFKIKKVCSIMQLGTQTYIMNDDHSKFNQHHHLINHKEKSFKISSFWLLRTLKGLLLAKLCLYFLNVNYPCHVARTSLVLIYLWLCTWLTLPHSPSTSPSVYLISSISISFILKYS